MCKNAGCGLVIGVLSGVNNKEELFKYGADMVLDSIMDLNDDTNTFDFLL
jgi:phosphoglycolate phosphatase-like HAD superfamily hydrolase